MAIKGVLRSSLIQIRVLDMEAALKHYIDLLGLNLVEKLSDGRVLLKGYDEFDHHSVVLVEADTAGLDLMGFKVESEEVLDEYKAATDAFGLENNWVEAESDQPGYGRRIAVKLPTGHRIDLYATVALAADHPELHNPNIWQREPHGMGALGFDHALLYGPNQKEAVRYFVEVLGLSVVEHVKLPDGSGNLVTWLTANNKAHDIAILEFDKPNVLHHLAFKLESWHDIGHAADLISVNNVSLDAGPMRHGVTRGQAIYFFDPSGNRNEVYAGGYAHYPDMPVRIWDYEQVGKGIFYYTRQLNENFLKVMT